MKHLILAITMALGGYTATASESGGDLPTGAYHHSSTGHISPGSHSVAVIAHANAELKRYGHEVLGERSECFLVPTPAGLSLEILSRRKFGQAEQLKLIQHIDIAIADGEKAAATYDNIRNTPNQTPQPNAGSRPSSGDSSASDRSSSLGPRG